MNQKAKESHTFREAERTNSERQIKPIQRNRSNQFREADIFN